MTPKTFVPFDAAKHGDYRTAREDGICQWCRQVYHAGDKINWNPRVANTRCHAGCYKHYGSPNPNFKPYQEYRVGDEFHISQFNGTCKWCGGNFAPGDKVNWTPKVKGTACHAGCYREYGSPVVSNPNPTSEPTFISPPKPTTTLTVATPPSTSNGLPQAIVDAIIPFLEGRLQGLVTEEQVTSIISKVLDASTLKRVTSIIIEQEGDEFGLETKDLGLQHKKFPLLMQCLKARDNDGYPLNIMLTGPAGTGKTKAAMEVARALGVPFEVSPAIDTKYDYLGYMFGKKLISTPTRKIWQGGGVLLQDELDGTSNPGALLPWNAGLANHMMAFPDGLMEQHKNCYIIAAMNTWGLGATNDFVGRTKLDATTLNRFVPIYWDIDEELELAIAQDSDWTKKVQKTRAGIKRAGVKGVMVTPRQSIYGAALLRAGVPQETVEEMLLKQSMTDSQWASVKS